MFCLSKIIPLSFSCYFYFYLFLILITMRGAHAAPNSCIAVSDDEYLCTADPAGSRRQNLLETKNQFSSYPFHYTMMNQGVMQRIDGSDAEKIAVKQLLQQMDEYFLNEVFAKPEYARVRGKWWAPFLAHWIEMDPFFWIIFVWLTHSCSLLLRQYKHKWTLCILGGSWWMWNE